MQHKAIRKNIDLPHEEKNKPKTNSKQPETKLEKLKQMETPLQYKPVNTT